MGATCEGPYETVSSVRPSHRDPHRQTPFSCNIEHIGIQHGASKTRMSARKNNDLSMDTPPCCSFQTFSAQIHGRLPASAGCLHHYRRYTTRYHGRIKISLNVGAEVVRQLNCLRLGFFPTPPLETLSVPPKNTTRFALIAGRPARSLCT